MKCSTPLVHGKEWILRDEQPDSTEGLLRLKSIELEENLRRKDMEWPEQVAAKAKLLEMMQSIHGTQTIGGQTREEKRSGETEGFGVRKLAAMLGESPATVSNDLHLAKLVEALPALKNQANKSAAFRTGTIAVATMVLKQKAAQAASTVTASAPKPKKYVLHEGDFQNNISAIPDASVDLVYTDLPYGVNLDKMQNHATGVVSYADKRATIVAQLDEVAKESFRILKDDRFCVFWFGFNYYTELVTSLTKAGFNVNPVPVVWLKHRNSAEAPLFLYANGYEQAIVARKGTAKFIRPGQVNIVDVPAIPPSTRIQVAQQPVQLVDRFINDMTLPTMTVVDLCAGSGTTGESAIRLGRRPILFERDMTQCLLIKQRLDTL
jgi:DNA modification methylase